MHHKYAYEIQQSEGAFACTDGRIAAITEFGIGRCALAGRVAPTQVYNLSIHENKDLQEDNVNLSLSRG